MRSILKRGQAIGQTVGLLRLDKKLKNTFQRIREEMDEHLQSINENTNEITSNYEYLCEIEAKMEKLTERVDQIYMLMQTKLDIKSPLTKEIKPLSKNEQDVFTVMYLLQEEKGTVTFADIAKNLMTNEEIVSEHINSIIDKGVPITKKFIDNETYLKLDKDFKTLQSKENVLGIVH